MPPSIPTPSDFPPGLHPIISTSPNPPPSQPLSNLILFLPGLGDTSTNFSSFPLALNLPSTTTITLQAPIPIHIPFLSDSSSTTHWADDLLLDSTTGTIDPDGPSFNISMNLIAKDVVGDLLMGKCGWKAREILILGYGQGGGVALAVAAYLHTSLQGQPLGGVIAIGGVLPLAHVLVNQGRSGTPVLILGGARGVLAREEGAGVKRTEGAFEDVEVRTWRKGDDGMPKSRDEAMPMMSFFARRLRSRHGVPEGAVEVG